MSFKDLVAKITPHWGKAVEELDEKGRPKPVEGKNVLIIDEDADRYGEVPYAPYFKAKPTEDPTMELGI